MPSTRTSVEIPRTASSSRRCVLAMVVSVLASSTSADVSANGFCQIVGDFAVSKGVLFEQVADNTPPASADHYFFDAFIETFPGAVAEASVSVDGHEVGLFGDGTGFWETDGPNEDFATQAGLDALFPSNSLYTFDISRGSLGERTQDITLGSDDYPAPPYLVGTSFSDLSGMNADQDRSIDWTATTADRVFVEFEEVDSEIERLVIEVDPSQTTLTIPAGTLEGGLEHRLTLSFINGDEILGSNCPGFELGSVGTAAFVSSTSVSFTTAPPCLVDFNSDGVLNFFDAQIFLGYFAAQNPLADLVNDGIFDFFDVQAFLSAFAAGCP